MTITDLNAFVRKYPLPLIGGVLSLVLAGAIYFRSAEVPAAAQILEDKTAEAQRYSNNLTNAAQLTEQFDALLAANKGIEGRLVHASQLGINQQYFYKLEADFGVKLTDVHQTLGRAQPATGKAGFVPIGFTVSVQGDFRSVLGFLQEVERGAHLCRVLSATCTGTRGGPVMLAISLEFLGQP